MMLNFNYDIEQQNLFVKLPETMKFDYEFHCDISELLRYSLESEEDVSIVSVFCEKGSDYENMCKAYLLNVLRFLMKRKRVRWNKDLAEIIIGAVEKRDGARFTEIDIGKEILKENLIYYDFKGDKDVQRPVDQIAKILVDKNLTINSAAVKEFLSTAIGEIFSNAINHSGQDEIFFMYDIMYDERDVYLCVNIIDYGTTIISNVEKYFKMKNMDMEDGEKCISWAIKERNTTRDGSGGYGLPTLISYIRKTNGELFIFSGNESFKLEKNGENHTNTIHGEFYGTSITFKVKLYDTNKRIKYDKSTEQLVSIGLDSI